jgi:hypothetical protein
VHALDKAERKTARRKAEEDMAGQWSRQEILWEKERRRKANRAKKSKRKHRKGGEEGDEGEAGEEGEEGEQSENGRSASARGTDVDQIRARA